MRSPLASSLLAVLVAVSGTTPPASAQGAPASPQAAAVVAFALDQFKALTPATTLDRWRATHPDDSVTRYVPPEQEDQHRSWCAHLDATSRIGDGHRVHRAIWFYPPTPPASTRSLPVASAATLFGQCTAGLVEIEVTANDGAPIASLDSAVTQLLTARFGSPVKAPEYGNEVNWSNHARWGGTGVTIIAGFDQPPRTAQEKEQALLLTAAAIGGEMHAQEFNFDFTGPPTGPPARIDELFALAGAGTTIEHELRASLADVHRSVDAPLLPTAPQTDRFINAFAAWLTRAATLPPSQHAAALLVADTVIASSAGTGWGGDTAYADVRRRLNALGAGLTYNHMADGVLYDRSFLMQALPVAPGTRAGDIAFLTGARFGFSLNDCAGEGSGFRAVAARGADYIARFPHSTAVPELHFIVARAWGDIINLGSGGGIEVEEEERTKDAAEIPTAREHAIAEYRLALATLPDGRERRIAWTEGWRLMAGLAPIISHFYCTDD